MTKEEATERWAEFGRRIMAEHKVDHGCDVDGGTIQDIAVELGVLQVVEVTEPCGDHCACAEVGDFPLSCYRVFDQ